MGEWGEGRYDIIVHYGEPKIRNKVFLEEMKGTYIKRWAKKHKLQAKIKKKKSTKNWQYNTTELR